MDFAMYRQITPETTLYASYPDSAHSRTTSNSSCYSQDSSPNSVATRATTPPKSPLRYGATLLPKVRIQDQIKEPVSGPVRHRRTVSTTSTGFPANFNPYTQAQRPMATRRSTSPESSDYIISPVSASSPYDSLFHSALNSPVTFAAPQSQLSRPSMAHSRSTSASAIHQHRRSGSGSSIDESVIGRFGYPTYRNMPTYVTSATPAAPSVSYTSTRPVSYSQVQHMTQETHTIQTALPVQAPYPVQTETSLLEYLTAPNPSPSLVRRITSVNRALNLNFWWDIRNLRSWNDFNVSNMLAIPRFPELLNVKVPESFLPTPAKPTLMPETESALQDIYRDYHATKVNAALRMCQGESHIMMRAQKTLADARQKPDFVSSYQSDYERTIYGDGRGRVVGLVKAYDQWNTGMRREAANKQVYYLQGLAHLHRLMREHGCRYGFIMTEIELLCVRCGGPSTTESSSGIAPIFGYLELADPIQLSTHGLHAETGAVHLTAGLALWYLHMLAKENPLPGKGTWRMDVGGPAALTRQNCIDKDEWIPKPQLGEKREAKRIRGWVWPEEALSRKECGKNRRAKTSRA
ncbi:hypothetical protein M501DRAFT_985930 [Patellaria atrata CBS 101060]|uniref:Sialidase n=1 Tax=Patellaria atrata CBS 101060 TaxID=1346257 RepID=A0A9P4S7Y6_9PEZI|nr:hypothetical protein M501DRAFT_985930 [Patellaria atrata CBS 101060]